MQRYTDTMSVMIESIHFKNFRCLRDSTLPLSAFTLLVGPNGSGKSTALEGIKCAFGPLPLDSIRPAVICPGDAFSCGMRWAVRQGQQTDCYSNMMRFQGDSWSHHEVDQVPPDKVQELHDRIRIYSLHADAIARPVQLRPHTQLGPNGERLAGVLDRLRDEHPERFRQVNAVLGEWLPEYDHILFRTPAEGTRAFELRSAATGTPIRAEYLSHGTLCALALLTLAYLPDPPPIIGLEEPDRGIHPRLLREVRDALYRLTYPQDFGEDREPVQVIATTHSPYMLDLFGDHPEEVVIAQKVEDNVKFQRLSDLPNIEELLGDTPLGEAWYSGILGGVPAES